MPALALLLLLASAPGDDLRAHYDRLCLQVAAAYDTARGGFVARNGVPDESAVELALLRAGETDGGPWMDRARATIAWTRGLRDTIGGGFYHGGTRQPGGDVLGKRADSNARRLDVLLRAWQVTGKTAYRDDAARVVDFMERVLLDGRGGFVSSQVGDRDLVPEANGHALRAWLLWSAATLDLPRRDFTLRSLDRLWETCWVEGFGLMRRNGFGDVLDEPRLVDQVEMGRAYVLAASLCGRSRDRNRARMIGELLLARFEEAGRGGLRTRSMPKKDGSIRRAPLHARENARAALFLYELASITEEGRYRAAADRVWPAFRKSLAKPGLDGADWALAARASSAPGLPDPPDWGKGRERSSPARRRSVTVKLGH